MKQNFLDAASQAIRAACDGDAEAAGHLPLFIPGLEAGAVEENLTAAYYAAHVHDLGLGVDVNRARAFALVCLVNRPPGPQLDHRFGAVLKDWFACWEREIAGADRERARQYLHHFERMRGAAPRQRRD